jgi:hypothetical protein
LNYTRKTKQPATVAAEQERLANIGRDHQQHTRMLSVARDLLAPVAAAATRTSLELMLL